uniref:Uncharacterized protein n=1 Tax=Rhizophagus irregularis (strain DAOM 181602 / DAOM 197198 / MUCL 43194) TaxID=747089 RepID=U9SYT4_RHIID
MIVMIGIIGDILTMKEINGIVTKTEDIPRTDPLANEVKVKLIYYIVIRFKCVV